MFLPEQCCDAQSAVEQSHLENLVVPLFKSFVDGQSNDGLKLQRNLHVRYLHSGLSTLPAGEFWRATARHTRGMTRGHCWCSSYPHGGDMMRHGAG